MSGPKKLTAAEVDRYRRDGFVFPVDVMSPEKARAFRKQLEQAEEAHASALNAHQRNNAHLTFTFLDELVHHRAIVDAVEDLIGPDILAFGTVLFIKEPSSPGFVSWHQDYTYMGLEPPEGVSAWLALSPSTVQTGCMKMVPGTHRQGIMPHRDTFGENNILTRGQVIDDIDTRDAVNVELEPGQMSLHHPRVVHGSEPNTGAGRRIGFVIQAYIPPHVRQTKCRGYATLVRGEDTHGSYTLLPRPQADMEAAAQALRREVNAAREEVLYEGTTGERRY